MQTADRRSWLFPPLSGAMHGIDLSLLDPDDEDERGLLIEGEHPELWDALARHADEVVLHGQPMNPRLHISMHEVVANQILDDDPPETWQTAQRLLDAGYERHEVLHMLGSAVSAELWQVTHEHEPFDRERYLAALRDLPDSWEAIRPAAPPNRAERRQRHRRH